MYSKPIDKTGQSKVQKNIETAWNCYLPGKVISNKIMEADEYYIYMCVCTYVHVYIYIYTSLSHALGLSDREVRPNAMAFAGHPIVFGLKLTAQFFKPAAGATL